MQLRLVDPPKNYKDSEARRMSVGAFDVLKRCQVFSSLSDALKDVSIAIGTTSGQSRETPEPLSAITHSAIRCSQNQLVAFVFGDERDGLTRDELMRCHRTISIPTNPAFSALNVAQAVGIIAYELSREKLNEENESQEMHPDGKLDDELFLQVDELLDNIEFTRKFNRHVILRELRSLYQRSFFTQRERDLLSGIIRRLKQKIIESESSRTL
jgi:tRNA (cytidine32/uridine32-2'-O)-methyltransferase